MAVSFADYVKVVYDMLLHPVSSEGHHPSPNRRRFRNEILRYYEENPTADTDILAALDFMLLSYLIVLLKNTVGVVCLPARIKMVSLM